MTRKDALDKAFKLGFEDVNAFSIPETTASRSGKNLLVKFSFPGARFGDRRFLRSAYMAGRWEARFPSKDK